MRRSGVHGLSNANEDSNAKTALENNYSISPSERGELGYVSIDHGYNHLTGIKKHLRSNYDTDLDFELPDDIAKLLAQLDRAP